MLKKASIVIFLFWFGFASSFPVLAQGPISSLERLGTWQIQHQFSDDLLYISDLDAVSSDEVWAVGSSVGNKQAVVFRYKNGSWSEMSLGQLFANNNCSRLVAVDMINSNVGWMIGAEDADCNFYAEPPVLIKYQNGVFSKIDTSVLQNNVNFLAVSALDSQNVWVAGAGHISHYDGTSWTIEASGSSYPLVESLDILSPTFGWAGGVYIWKYDGSNWSDVLLYPSVRDVDAISTTQAWAVGYDGQILHYNGTAWQFQSTPVTDTLHSVSMTSIGQGFAAGDNGTLLYYDGYSWRKMPTPTTDRIESISARVSNDGLIYAWALTADNTVLRYVGSPAPAPVAVDISPSGGELLFQQYQQNTRVIFPKNAVTETIRITYTYGFPMDANPLVGIGYFFDLATSVHPTETLQFNQPITIVTRYTDEQIGPAVSNTLRLYWLDGTSWSTSGLTSIWSENVITSTTTHFTTFALLGETNRTYLPVVFKE
ncbi:MAG: hypothetical protein D6732_29005 [Methanobacteriota archaeon]|nr:MAG: hypothetical protein D6732_29005 [Euryarchaeota archaeon]